MKKFSILNSQFSISPGLTLLELLITIAILGMMVAVLFAIVNPLEQNRKANDSVMQQTAHEFLQASYRYSTDNDAFPWNQSSCVTSGSTPVLSPTPGGGVTAGLVSYWRLDETSGASASDGIGSNTGSAASGASVDTITYKIGGASRSLNGTSTGYLSLGNTSSNLNQTGAISINLWVKHNAVSPNSKDYVCGDSAGSYCFYWGSTGILTFAKNGTSTITATNMSISDTNWHMMTVTFDGSNVSFYKDGVIDSATPHAFPQTFTTGHQYYLGWDGATANFEMVGNIDNAGVWSRGLSSAEVSSIYSTENAGTSIITNVTPTPLPGSGSSSLSSPTSLASLNTCINTMISGGYIKGSINLEPSGILNGIYIVQPNPLITPLDPLTLSACYLPKSRSAQQDPLAKYVQNGNLAPYSGTTVIAGYDQNGNAVSTGSCISAGGSNYCYVCVY